MNLEGYFIADDAHDVPTVWHAMRPDDPTPRAVINMFDLRHDPRLWDAVVALVEGAS